MSKQTIKLPWSVFLFIIALFALSFIGLVKLFEMMWKVVR